MLMKTQELCEELKIHQNTLYRWMKRYPDFPAFKFGSQGHYRFEMSKVQQWMNRHQFDANFVEKEDANE